VTIGWHSREELLLKVVTLVTQGSSQRAAARALGISRNTVKVLLRVHRVHRASAHSALPQPSSRAPRAQKVDAFKPRVAALMEKYSDITAQRVFEILRAEGFDGGYTAIKNYVRVVRPPHKPAPSLVTPEYGPGEMGESDWSPYDIRFITGKMAKVQALSYVLCVSKRKHFELYDTNDLHALMDGHTLAFGRMEGCAMQVRQPEASGSALGRQSADLQSAIPRILEPLRVSAACRPPRTPQRQAADGEVVLGGRALVSQCSRVP
jgi:transposase